MHEPEADMGMHLNLIACTHCKMQQAVHKKGSKSAAWTSGLLPRRRFHLPAMSLHKLPAPLVSLHHAMIAGSSTKRRPQWVLLASHMGNHPQTPNCCRRHRLQIHD